MFNASMEPLGSDRQRPARACPPAHNNILSNQTRLLYDIGEKADWDKHGLFPIQQTIRWKRFFFLSSDLPVPEGGKPPSCDADTTVPHRNPRRGEETPINSHQQVVFRCLFVPSEIRSKKGSISKKNNIPPSSGADHILPSQMASFTLVAPALRNLNSTPESSRKTTAVSTLIPVSANRVLTEQFSSA